MIYLASPYNHADPLIREGRFRAVCAVAAAWMREGLHVFCPVAHSHPIALAGGLPLGWDYWREYDRWFIEQCSEVRVLMLPGWEESVGIKGELAMARAWAPVTYWRWDGERAIKEPHS